MRCLVLSVALLGVAGCKKAETARDEKPAATKTESAANDPCAKAKREGALAWIHDDYAAAVACAKARNVPVVLDLWAPWCHTCLSMQTTVFANKALEPRGDKFVFAALDTDRDVNADAVAKYPMSAWPTFYVIAPDETVLARFVGAASLPQFQAFLDAGARAMAGGVEGPDAHLLAAERAIAAKDLDKADVELALAIEAAPADWPRLPDALVSWIGTRSKRGDVAGCLDLGEKWLDKTGNAASASDFLYHATSCATKAATEPANAERVKALRERAVTRWKQLADDGSAPMSVDDRSDVLMYLRETLVTLGQPDEARAIAERQRTMLDEAANTATSPIAAMTYNWPRAEVYVFLGKPLELVPALEKSVKDLPGEYDPPARLGWIYLKAGKLAEAAQWTEKALALAYGPRKTRVLAQRIEIAAKQGDKAAERKFREELVKTYEALPASQAQPEALAKAKQALAELAAPAPSTP